VPGYDTPRTTQHIYDAITGSGGTKSLGGKAPFALKRYKPPHSRDDTLKREGSWYDYEPNCLKWFGDSNTIPSGKTYLRWKDDSQNCDEYPFASSAQGGFSNYLLC
jgi:hypothetical protein